MSSIGGSATSNFFDGSTADYVTEQPDLNGTQLQLRKPHLGNTSMFYAKANGYPLSHYPGTRVSEVHSAVVQTSGFDGTHAWYDYWKACN